MCHRFQEIKVGAHQYGCSVLGALTWLRCSVLQFSGARYSTVPVYLCTSAAVQTPMLHEYPKSCTNSERDFPWDSRKGPRIGQSVGCLTISFKNYVAVCENPWSSRPGTATAVRRKFATSRMTPFVFACALDSPGPLISMLFTVLPLGVYGHFADRSSQQQIVKLIKR